MWLPDVPPSWSHTRNLQDLSRHEVCRASSPVKVDNGICHCYVTCVISEDGSCITGSQGACRCQVKSTALERLLTLIYSFVDIRIPYLQSQEVFTKLIWIRYLSSLIFKTHNILHKAFDERELFFYLSEFRSDFWMVSIEYPKYRLLVLKLLLNRCF